MKLGFIRALWGVYDHAGKSHFWARRTKIDNDIELVLHNKYMPNFKTYVFGKDNYKFLVDKGYNCQLLDDNPVVWDIDTQQFRHKFEAFKFAAEEFDKFVFLDWDMMMIKPLPSDFWDVLAQKATLQAVMRIYHKRKAFWRGAGARTVPCGSFIYVGDKTIPIKLIEIWEQLNKPWGEEVVMGKYTEDIMGGFTGSPEDMEKYWNMFEPPYFTLQQMFPKEKMATKTPIVYHCTARAVANYLKHVNNSPKIDFDWLQKEKRDYRIS